MPQAPQRSPWGERHQGAVSPAPPRVARGWKAAQAPGNEPLDNGGSGGGLSVRPAPNARASSAENLGFGAPVYAREYAARHGGRSPNLQARRGRPPQIGVSGLGVGMPPHCCVWHRPADVPARPSVCWGVDCAHTHHTQNTCTCICNSCATGIHAHMQHTHTRNKHATNTHTREHRGGEGAQSTRARVHVRCVTFDSSHNDTPLLPILPAFAF